MPEDVSPQNNPAPDTAQAAEAVDTSAPTTDIATAQTDLAPGTSAEQAQDIQERVARIIRRFSIRG